MIIIIQILYKFPPLLPILIFTCAEHSMATYEKLFISHNPDGSLCRNYPFPFTPPTHQQIPSQNPPSPSLSKDVPLDSARGTSIRIFIPQPSSPSGDKLPIIIYFHPGGFILCSPAIAPVHDFTARLSAGLPAAVLSVDHRLAPEHRLPAAYDDALDALLWLRDRPDPWVERHADLSRCFLMGSSSGGNIAYHLALRASSSVDTAPVNIAGVVMDQPFFGGEERTGSEMRMADDKLVPLAVTDLMWELALPVGADRNHGYSNPKPLKGKGEGMGRCFVRGYLGDPLIDRMRAMVAMMERGGVEVVASLEEEGSHGAEMFDDGKAEAMVDDVRDFVYDRGL